MSIKFDWFNIDEKTEELNLKHKFKGSVYKFKILSLIKNYNIRKGILSDRLILAKVKNDKYWKLVLIQLINYDRDTGNLLSCKSAIYVDKNMKISYINNDPDDLYIDEALNNFESFNEDMYYGNGSTVKSSVMIHYYYSWFSQHKTYQTLKKLKLINQNNDHKINVDTNTDDDDNESDYDKSKSNK